MNLKPVFFYVLIVTALLLSAFGSTSPAAQATVTVPAVTLPPLGMSSVYMTAILPAGETTTPVGIPVTGGGDYDGWWMIILFALLALLSIAFVVAIFSPRIAGEPLDRHPPSPPEE